MTMLAQPVSTDPAKRMEELGRIILAYSEVTEKLQQSHAQLQQQVANLRNDLAEKDRQLQRRKHLAALGEMAAGLAHEIRNPLGGIQLYASLLAKDLQQQPQPRQLVEKISKGVKQLEWIVSQVLQFSREISAQRVEADLAQVVEQAVELAQGRLQQNACTIELAGPRPLPARIDPLQMGQAVLNLVLNAIEAAGANGRVAIAWRAAPVDSGHRFYLSIHDSGPGIAAGVIERIFHPFFTTKENGTGLGLAIVHRIVEAHDGVISVANAPQGGAIFELRA